MKNKIHLNQVGYISSMPKAAIVNAESGSPFYVCRKKDGTTAYEGILTDFKKDVASGDKTSKAVFSEMKEEGTFYIKTGAFASPSFTISKNPFSKIKNDVLKSFYFARCGIPLDEKYAGPYARYECHISMPSHIDNLTQKNDVSGGWHDAGDYGRYIISGVNALAMLLYSYILIPESFQKEINIPESGNGMPDILNQCKYELDWLLKMQDSDGGVFHKVCSLESSENVMPSEDFQEQFVFPKSCDATLCFCAVTALAGRIYEEFDYEFSQKLKSASLFAWIWAADKDSPKPFQKTETYLNEKYICTELDDKFFWAASELYTTTGEQPFHETMKKLYDSIDTTSFCWQRCGGFGALSYIINGRKKDDIMYDVLQTAFIYRADNLVSMSKHSGYSTALPANRYIYGSNMDICMSGLTLILADILSPNKEYIYTALEELNYILGKNPMGICYITGYGENSVLNPHHRPCTSDEIDAPIKGLMVGGANMMRSDEYCKWVIPKSTPPAKCYVDKEHSYAVNNTTIYWNASAVCLMSHFSDTGDFKD